MGARRSQVPFRPIKDVWNNAQSSPTSSESPASLPSPATPPPEKKYAMSHWKNRLHNRVAAYGWSTPTYDHVQTSVGGATRWIAIVRIDGAEWSRAEGSTMASADNDAACLAWQKLTAEGYPERF
ncbi:uncharacterized protein SCHCODRAFT_02751789 [Schizophyllum commune H4-8]|nr:uncharacterized protein SCHCODRAFT_02751789 [Schizophyllum commune H4-8]KAI5888743.1 hypothetical protein SCHCODRAFT_02751789 [Schizophyllum commune H4-8]